MTFENRPKPKSKVVFQPSIFRGFISLLVSGSVTLKLPKKGEDSNPLIGLQDHKLDVSWAFAKPGSKLGISKNGRIFCFRRSFKFSPQEVERLWCFFDNLTLPRRQFFFLGGAKKFGKKSRIGIHEHFRFRNIPWKQQKRI